MPITGAAIAIGSFLFVADPAAPSSPGSVSFRLSNGLVYREFVVERGVLRTVAWGREGEASQAWRTDPSTREFEIVLTGGTALDNRDYQTSISPSTGSDKGVSSIAIPLHPRQPSHPSVVLHYEAVTGQPWLRKRIEITGTTSVETLHVESLDISVGSVGGGVGLPIFVDRAVFSGLEYPAGIQAIEGSTLHAGHHPRQQRFVSPQAVLGLAEVNEPVGEAFLRYVQQNRPRRGPFLLFSSWFDSRGEDLTPTACEKLFQSLHENLLIPFELSLDTFLVDDGYQDPQTLWQPGSRWPDGFRPLVAELERKGSHLGVWMPLNGLGLDPSQGPRRGWSLAKWDDKTFFSLADPTYEKSLRQVIDQFIDRDQITCLKHDFNFFAARTKEGQDPAIDTTFESITDATIRLLDGTRAKKPGIFLSLTSGTPLSPWWLWHADALWMGHGDYNLDWSFPQSTARHAEMTYRDEKLYRRLRIEKVPLPPSSLMTHGVIRGKLDETNPPTSLADWNDYVVFTLGRGTELQELYISPDAMQDKHGKPSGWNELGSALRWAQKHRETFEHTVMIGGNPGKGEGYGFVHWSDAMGIFVLRNPSIVPREITLSTDQRPRLLRERPDWKPIVVYPHRERLVDLLPGRSVPVEMPGESVVVVHLYADLPEAIRPLPLGRFRINEGDGTIDLVKYRSAQVVPLMETIDEQTLWRGEFRLGGTDGASELLLASQPAAGVRFQIDARSILSEHRADWGLDRYRGIHEKIRPSATILPTPIFPEQSRATAVLRTKSPIDQRRTVPLVGEIPAWPAAIDDRENSRVEDHVLFENRIFTRGRKLVERLAWWVGLVFLPTMLVGGLASMLFRSVGRRWRWMAGIGAMLLFSLVYLIPPVSSWLVHLLQEEM
jgi:hypothetical protein